MAAQMIRSREGFQILDMRLYKKWSKTGELPPPHNGRADLDARMCSTWIKTILQKQLPKMKDKLGQQRLFNRAVERFIEADNRHIWTLNKHHKFFRHCFVYSRSATRYIAEAYLIHDLEKPDMSKFDCAKNNSEAWNQWFNKNLS